jgi:hypothetical protein
MKAARRSPGDVSTAAGSLIPQCALTGSPGQCGHGSPAVTSQMVSAISMAGAPAPEKASQSFGRRSVVG